MTTSIGRNESIHNRLDDETRKTVSWDARLNMMTLQKYADKHYTSYNPNTQDKLKANK